MKSHWNNKCTHWVIATSPCFKGVCHLRVSIWASIDCSLMCQLHSPSSNAWEDSNVVHVLACFIVISFWISTIDVACATSYIAVTIRSTKEVTISSAQFESWRELRVSFNSRGLNDDWLFNSCGLNDDWLWDSKSLYRLQVVSRFAWLLYSPSQVTPQLNELGTPGKSTAPAFVRCERANEWHS